MRTLNLFLTAALLASMSAAAQQAADSQPSAQPAAPDATQTASPSQPAAAAPDASQTSQAAAAPDQTQPAQTQASQPAVIPPPAVVAAPTTMDQVVNLFIEREHGLIKMLSNRTPVVETYLQNLTADPQLGPVPSEDHYFLGRLDMGEVVDRKDYLKEEEKGMQARLLGGFTKLYKVQYQPMGFSWMVYADRTDFDRDHYDFHYVRREFLGEVRCLVFDVTPKPKSGHGRFLGRLWVEDQGFNIVRLNGTYYPAPRNSYFFHMDSWRLNLIPGYWVPAFIYSEEGDFSAGVKNKLAFKAQTRIWGYDLKKGGKDDELTNIRVDSVTDESATQQDASPLQASACGSSRQKTTSSSASPKRACLLPRAMSTASFRPSSTISKSPTTSTCHVRFAPAFCLHPRWKLSASAIPSSSAVDWWTCFPTRPALPRFSRMNSPTSSSDTTSGRNTRSTTACCSPTTPLIRTSASNTFPRKKLQPTKKRWTS